MYSKLFILFLCSLAGMCEGWTYVVPDPVKGVYVSYEDIVWANVTSGVQDAIDAGYNTLYITFLAPGYNDYDMAEAWAGATAASKQAIITYAHNRNTTILLTAKFLSEYGVVYAQDPTALGISIATWANSQYLDGVDLFFQDISPGFIAPNSTDPPTLVDWCVNVTLAVASALAPGKIITLSGQPAYFGPIGSNSSWVGTTGGLVGVYNRVSDLISLVNIFYLYLNPGCGQSYNTVFIASDCVSGISVEQISDAGIPLSKIVVVKPVAPGGTGGGYVAASSLSSYVEEAWTDLGWDTGVAVWCWDDKVQLALWINSVYPPAPATTTATPTGIVTTSAVSSTTSAKSNTTTGATTHSSTTATPTTTTTTQTTTQTTSKTATTTGAPVSSDGSVRQITFATSVIVFISFALSGML